MEEERFVTRHENIYMATESVKAFSEQEILKFLNKYPEGQRFDIPELNGPLINEIKDYVVITDNSIYKNQKIIKAAFNAIGFILENFSKLDQKSLKKLFSDVGRVLLYHNDQEISIRRKNIKDNVEAPMEKMLKNDNTDKFLFEMIPNDGDPMIVQSSSIPPNWVNYVESIHLEPKCVIESTFQKASQHDASSRVDTSFDRNVRELNVLQRSSSIVENRDQHPSTSYQTAQHSYGNEESKMAEKKWKLQSKNIVLRDVPETFTDKEVYNILRSIGLDTQIEHMRGRFGQESEFGNRPYRVTLESEKDVEIAMNQSRPLERGIYIERDIILNFMKKFEEPSSKRSPIKIKSIENEYSPEKRMRTHEILNRDRVLLYYQNVRSLNNKLTDVTAQSLQSVDVLIITETWLQPNTTSESLLFNLLDDYNIFRCDRDLLYTNLQRGGGVLIAMKKKWFAERIDIRISVECIILQTVLKQKKIILCAVYIPPNSFGEHSEFLSALDSVAQNFPDHELIVIGDFNIPRIKWDNDPLRCTVTRYVPPAIKICADEMCDFFSILGFHQIIQPQTPENYTLDLLFSYPGLVRESDGNIIFRRDKNHPSSHWFEITV